jgi:tetratricopeptide (TPR) repeat protein
MSRNKLTEAEFELAKSHFLQGLECFNKEMFLEAEALFRKSLSIIPDRESTLTNLSATLVKLEKYSEAEKILKNVLEINNSNQEAWVNLGNVYVKTDREEQALASYEKALSINSKYAEAWSNRGKALIGINQNTEALASYDKAISLKPDYAEAWYNRGVLLSKLKHYDQALTSYDKAISLKPDYNSALWNKSLVQLVTGDFEGGWTNYEYRWLKNNAKDKHHQNFPALTSLNELGSSTVLVWWEQGLGDTIQFSRYAALLSELGENVVFDVQKPLKSLLQHSFPGIKVIKRDEPLRGIDFQIPLMSLPRLFSADLNNIPSSQGYLKPVPESIDLWRVKLNLSSSKPNIGIACSGNENHDNDKNRSMALSLFEPLLEVANLFLIQKHVRDSDKDFLSNHPEIKFLGDQISTFEDSASVVELLDLVVTVDTSLVHLSGALGKPAKVLVTWDPEWRWFLDREDSPWYHSVQVFRQPSPGNWKSVIQDIIIHLKQNA